MTKKAVIQQIEKTKFVVRAIIAEVQKINKKDQFDFTTAPKLANEIDDLKGAVDYLNAIIYQEEE